MILTLEIVKHGAADYEVVPRAGSVEVSTGSCGHNSIAAAIQASSMEIPEGFARFVEPRLAGVSAGTLPVEEARQPAGAEAAARRIVAILARMADG